MKRDPFEPRQRTLRQLYNHYLKQEQERGILPDEQRLLDKLA